ncbi:MAG: septum site-determining protein MinC [Anaerolineales bacterium]|nr:septum site-determining protein MinC [Anaerolineales bacterium]
MTDRIIIKGTSNGLIITMGPGEWQGLIEDLSAQLGAKASFFKGGRVALRVGARQLTPAQLTAVGETLNSHNVSLWAVESEDAGTRQAAALLSLETDIGPAKSKVNPPRVARSNIDSIVTRRTLRSGQILRHSGNVVIIGDVNPGAEIQAGGDVIVWGRLRGSVHAGVKTGSEAIVCALQLSPMQLRIGDVITLPPPDDAQREMIPEIASVQNGQIIAEPWRG